MWNDLFLGYRVFVSVICNAGWSYALFASYSQWIVGPFAMIVSQESCVFAMIVGREIPLFASPRVTVRKPLQLPPPTPSLFIRLMHVGSIIPELLGDCKRCLASLMRDASCLDGRVDDPHL